MGTYIFQGLHYHLQMYGMDRELQQKCRNALDSRGAVFRADPCDPLCTHIIVDTPNKTKGYTYRPSSVRIEKYSTLHRSGNWTYDGLCFHFSTRKAQQSDDPPKQWKVVVDTKWVEECIDKGMALFQDDHAKWEVRYADPIRRSHGRDPRLNRPGILSNANLGSESLMAFSTSASSIDVPQTPISLPSPIIPFVDPAASALDRQSQVPPSPPLTATSSVNGAADQKIFDSLTQNQYGAMTFYVASENYRGITESFIQINGGQIDDQIDAKFIVIDRVPSGDYSAIRKKLGQLRRNQIVVASQWIEDCGQRSTLLNHGEYTIDLRTDSTALQKLAAAEPVAAIPTIAPVEKPSLKRARSPTITESVKPIVIPPPRQNGTQQTSRHVPTAVDPRVRPRLSYEAKASTNPAPAYRIKPVPPLAAVVADQPAMPTLPLLPSDDDLKARFLALRNKKIPPDTPGPPQACVELMSHRTEPLVPAPSIDVPMTPPRTATAQPVTPPLPAHPSDTTANIPALAQLSVTAPKTPPPAPVTAAAIPPPVRFRRTVRDSLPPHLLVSAAKTSLPAHQSVTAAKTPPPAHLSATAPKTSLPTQLPVRIAKTPPPTRLAITTSTTPPPAHLSVTVAKTPLPTRLPVTTAHIPLSAQLPVRTPLLPIEIAKTPLPAQTPVAVLKSVDQPPVTEADPTADSHRTSISQIRLIHSPEREPFSIPPAPTPQAPEVPSVLPRASIPAQQIATPPREAPPKTPSDAPSPYYPSEPATPSRFLDVVDLTGAPSPEYFLEEPLPSPLEAMVSVSTPPKAGTHGSSLTPSPSSTEPSSSTASSELELTSADPASSSSPLSEEKGVIKPTPREPYFIIGGGPAPKDGPRLVAAVRLNQVITKLDEWLKPGEARTKTQLLLRLKRMESELDWHSLFYRKRGTIRATLLTMGHQVAVLDEVGIFDRDTK